VTEPGRALSISEPRATTTTGVDARGALERHAHLTELRRMRDLCLVAAIAMPAFFGYDLLFVAAGGQTDLALLALIRASFASYYWLVVARAGRTLSPISPAELAVHRWLLPTSLMLAIAALSIETGGLTSPYGASVILMPCSLLTSARPWRDAVPQAIVVNLVYPVAMLLSALAFPAISAQLHEPAALFDLFSNVALAATVTLTVVIATHLYWQLRRETFASKSIGRYELRRRLGRGGMGEVWAAWHAGLSREVAVKLLRIDAGREADTIAAQRFEREVRATVELSHPNTIRVLDFGTSDEGLLYYAMELLEGENVAQLVKREGALPPARAVHLTLQAARALGEAHARGIVHRDVKPENLFVTTAGGESDFVKVLDFGIAKSLAHPEGATLTQTGAIAGSATTVSPEVVSGKEVGPPADVYALGATLYFLLTGRYPFETNSSTTTMVAHLTEPVVPPSVRTQNEIPRDLEDVVMRSLQKEPGDRYVDARALAAALAESSLAGTWRPIATTSVSAVITRPTMPPTDDIPTRVEAARPVGD